MKSAAKNRREPIQMFQVSYPLYTVSCLIFITGASLGIILDVESGRLPTIINTTVGFLLLVTFFALGAFGRMRRSTALGASFLVTAAVWIIESFFTPGGDLPQLIGFLSNLVVLSSLLAAAGLMLNKVVSMVLSALLLLYLLAFGRPLSVPFPEIEYYLYFFVFIVSGLCFIIFYSRSQIERAMAEYAKLARAELAGSQLANSQREGGSTGSATPDTLRKLDYGDESPLHTTAGGSVGSVNSGSDQDVLYRFEIAAERSDLVIGEIASGLLHLCSSKQSTLPELGLSEHLLANYYLPLRRCARNDFQHVELRGLLDDAVDVAVASQKSHSVLFQVRVITRYDEQIAALSLCRHELFFALFAIFQTGFASVREKRIQSPNDFMPEISLELEQDEKAVHLLISGNCFENIEEFVERPPQNSLSGKQGEFGLRQVLRRVHQIIVVLHRGAFRVQANAPQDTEIRITIPV